MSIFKINKQKVIRCSINENGFGDEFALRDFFASNLEDLLGIRFIEKEYVIQEGRIDTLGLDENNSPVIIEYKWKENEEVLAQGLFYFSWLLKNKKHFELLVENKLGKTVEVQWDQPRVILVAQGFSRYIQGAVEQEKHIELLAYHFYQSDILHLETIYTPRAQVKVGKRINLTQKEEKLSLDYHLNKTTHAVQQKFKQLRESIMQLPSVEEKVLQKTGITYRTTKSFIRFEFRQKSISLLLRDAKYTIDTKGLVKDIESNEWGYKGLVKFDEDSDLDYVFNLIKESYQSTL